MKVTIREEPFTYLGVKDAYPWYWTVKDKDGFIECSYSETEEAAKREAKACIDYEIARRGMKTREFDYGPD